MAKPRRPVLNLSQARIYQSAVEAERYLDRLAVGSWTPNVDICETHRAVHVRVELPGVDLSEVTLSIQEGILRIQGVKREATAPAGQPRYHCLERRFGKFDRTIPIHWVVDARRAAAFLQNGVLTIELPKLEDRRGQALQIPVNRK